MVQLGKNKHRPLRGKGLVRNSIFSLWRENFVTFCHPKTLCPFSSDQISITWTRSCKITNLRERKGRASCLFLHCKILIRTLMSLYNIFRENISTYSKNWEFPAFFDLYSYKDTLSKNPMMLLAVFFTKPFGFRLGLG